MSIVPVIMAGGSGTRLWPLSRELNPKQFLKLVGESSLLQQTLARLSGLVCEESIIIANEEHRFLVAEQLRQSGDSAASILLEPCGRNTAPAIALAALCAQKGDSDPLLLVLAADHHIKNVEAFVDSVKEGMPAAEAGMMVTFGIVPTHPETGYGYIQAGDSQQGGASVKRFVEKPDAVTAKAYLEQGDYYWNSGMFLFKASTYISELKKYQPEILDACLSALDKGVKDLDFVRLDKDAFSACPADSIDYAVMEKTDKAVVVPMHAGWSDIGSWAALWSLHEKDANGNVNRGDVLRHNTQDTLVFADHRLVSTVGVKDLVIVETKDAVLVAHKDEVQHVKAIVQQIKDQGRSEHFNHREVYRPWGMYDSIDNGQRYQVKRISVKPGAKLSVQMHHHRAEHWIVVSGTAKVTNGEETYLVTENESTYIPVGQVHALENPGKIPLELIEIQSGGYLGEDDIVRFEDRYGRAKK